MRGRFAKWAGPVQSKFSSIWIGLARKKLGLIRVGLNFVSGRSSSKIEFFYFGLRPGFESGPFRTWARVGLGLFFFYDVREDFIFFLVFIFFVCLFLLHTKLKYQNIHKLSEFH